MCCREELCVSLQNSLNASQESQLVYVFNRNVENHFKSEAIHVKLQV